MRSIKYLFLEKQKENPNWGDFICLTEAVRNKGFSWKWLGIAIDELLPESADYESSEKKQYLEFLYSVSNPLVEGKNRGGNALKRA